MSNKKRISKRVKSIQGKYRMKHMSFMCAWLVSCIKAAQEFRISLRNSSAHYPSGGFIPNNGEPEKIIDSHGDEKVIEGYFKKVTDNNGIRWEYFKHL